VFLFWILSELRYLDLHRRSASVNHVVTRQRHWQNSENMVK
jgi:hypothetical protein